MEEESYPYRDDDLAACRYTTTAPHIMTGVSSGIDYTVRMSEFTSCNQDNENNVLTGQPQSYPVPAQIKTAL